LTALAVTTTARAGFFGAQPIDGPADIVSVGDVDVTRDGPGAVVYVRRDGGVPHPYVSRFTGGAFTPPERLDPGFDGPGSQPVVAVAGNGRIVAAFVSSGTVLTTIFDPKTNTWSSPQGISAGANPSLDISVHGVAGLVYSAAGDVRAARLDRTAQQFTVIDAPLDIDAANIAGEGTGRPRFAIGADGAGVAVWGEAGRVFARRIYRATVSVAPVDMTLADLEGRAGGVADLPDVAIEDDSSFAQVAFRQQFADPSGLQTRAVARRLRGSAVNPPAVVDGVSWGVAQVDSLSIDLNGRGDGAAATSLAGGTVTAAVLKDNVFAAGIGIGAGAAGSPKISTSDATSRVAGWLQATDGSVRSRFYDDSQSVRAVPAPGPESVASYSDFGPVDLAGGLEIASDRVGDFMLVFVQGVGDAKRLVYAAYDREPFAFSGYTGSSWRNPLSTSLSWAAPTELWGPVNYIVNVDGREIGRTTQTKFAIPPEALVPDGVRRWKVTAVDVRGQTTTSKTRTLRLDSVAPGALIELKRSGRKVTVNVVAADVVPQGGRASGVKTVAISFGDGSKAFNTRRATRKYPGTKRAFTIRAKVTDKAGNVTTEERAIKLPKSKSKSKKP
jgi:hypothetical protein